MKKKLIYAIIILAIGYGAYSYFTPSSIEGVNTESDSTTVDTTTNILIPDTAKIDTAKRD